MFQNFRTALAVLTAACVLPLAALAISPSGSQVGCACCGDACRCQECGCDAAGCSCDTDGECACSEECHASGCAHCGDA